MKIKALFFALLMLAAMPVAAAGRPDIVVEGVQMPAWVEHANGARDPLAIGMALTNKDRIFTGPESRALLRLADGSLIKLGENGLLALDDLGQKKIQLKDVVTASLDVVSGAFRFTTQALYKFHGERDVKVRIVTITAGIRGTDLWGKADKTRDIVCLIEGKITVARERDAFVMDQPLSFYIAPKNEPALPVAPVSQKQLDQWSLETDIASGAMRKGGKWRVYVADADNQGDALGIYEQLRSAGYAAEIRPVKNASGTMYRVRISNLPGRQDAAALAGKLKGTMGIAEPKVSK
ncbi:MAG TPA: SPOR domain-containing protein [Burkholderiales bacterium]|nr:SPOR domain-containing protein [Burkholderiales bacterium]